MIDFEDEISAALAEGDDELGFLEIWTPNRIHTYMKEVASKVVSMDRDIAANASCFTGNHLADWEDFKIRFAEFMDDHDDWWDRLSIGAMRQAERFALDLRDFQARFATACSKTPSGGSIRIPQEETDTRWASLGNTLTTLAVVTVVGILAFKFLDRR